MVAPSLLVISGLALFCFTGIYAHYGVGRAPANQACQKWDCTNSAPPVTVHYTRPNNGESKNNPDAPFHTAHILFHLTFPPLFWLSTHIL